MAAAGQLLKDFCERTLLPKLEERIARLNLIISNARKGFKNKLTRFWKGAATETVQYQVRWSGIVVTTAGNNASGCGGIYVLCVCVQCMVLLEHTMWCWGCRFGLGD
eukprot:GHUV01035873.1.p1 GENE.GHUV01035873.1~~GHUV01035873.1.p1  ORF type:complete len:107 (+),score=3.59 GHUV01035873.1:367-687(+)